ncbi:MAG: cysteine desulfurase [Planctomycetes bacterium]|nr:cysteine desulfurase [Planctomycetota bacterium]
MRRIYLDNAASTALDPRVARHMADLQAREFGNPSSLHAFGRARRRRLEDARSSIAARIGCAARDLRFCSGATEANNLALYGLAARAARERRRILVSPVEHPSVLEPLALLERLGFERVFMPVDECGVLLLEEASALLGPDVAFSSLMAVNNETGVVQPVADWAELCRRADVPLHCDAAQAVGRMPVDVATLAVDALVFSAHKFHGPAGIGALVLRPDLGVEALLVGGGQERGLRAGTENVTAASGMALALTLALDELDERQEHIRRLADRLEMALAQQLPTVILNAAGTKRWPGILNLRLPKQRGETLMMKLDLEGFATSLGAACSSGSLQPSHVLAAMGLDPLDNLSSLRVSLSAANDAAEIDAFVASLSRIVAEGR